jgi:hypothetical protein
MKQTERMPRTRTLRGAAQFAAGHAVLRRWG